MIKLQFSKTLRASTSIFNLAIDLELASNCKTVFFGASGSGKTLTLQCLAGLNYPDTGLIEINGQTLYSQKDQIYLEARERNIGYMFQDYAIFPHLNVLQNVAWAAGVIFPWQMTKEQKTRAMAMLERLEIAHLANNYPRQISGGQQQRVALARALNSNPKLLLLDEPFSSLDPLLRLRLRQELQAFICKLNLPCIIVTHDPADVETFADDLVIYQQGQAKLYKNYQDIAKNYSNSQVCLTSLLEETARFNSTKASNSKADLQNIAA